MQFTMLCCFEEKRWESLPEGDRRKIMADYRAFDDCLMESGQLVTTMKLEPSSAAATVRMKNGNRLATDGPFAEAKEQLGGVHLIACKDLEEAIAIAGRIPTLPAGGSVEVRPVTRTFGR